MEFTPINTQEEFDTRVAELYGDVNDLQGKITAHTKTIEQLQGQIKGYETAALKQRIAQEKGIPAEMAARLSGEGHPDGCRRHGRHDPHDQRPRAAARSHGKGS